MGATVAVANLLLFPEQLQLAHGLFLPRICLHIAGMMSFRCAVFLFFCPVPLAAQGDASAVLPPIGSAYEVVQGAAKTQPMGDPSGGVSTTDVIMADLAAPLQIKSHTFDRGTPLSVTLASQQRPQARPTALPHTRWEHRKGHAQWTRAALSALRGHGKPLVDLVPRDIATWCPAYPQASDADRRAFWVGFLSALAKYESNYKPHVVGGGGKWHGLLQILPGTARGYKCQARTGKALRDGGANLSCAIRIMARTVPRDGVIHGYKNKKGQGVTADWGPMHSKPKRREMAAWLRGQGYCQSVATKRPKPRP